MNQFKTVDIIEFVKLHWSPELKRVYQAVPSSLRSKNWPEIARLANAGDVDKALELARQSEERSPKAQRENVIARRMRVERVSLFSRMTRAKKDLGLIIGRAGEKVARTIDRIGATEKTLPRINARIEDVMVEMRGEIRKWFRRTVRDSVVLGLRNAGNAILPIIKANREAVEENAELNLIEARRSGVPLSIGLKTNFAKKANPVVALKTQKWARVMKRIMKRITKKAIGGLTPSERIWELSRQSTSQLKRMVSTQVSQGKSPFTISTKVKKFLSPAVLAQKDLGVQLGAGVYRNPFRNAMRLARTEANRAYTQASAAWAEDKDFIKGIQITLSPAHGDADECDDLAKLPTMTPERFAELIPAHPHCMCYATYVFQDNVIEDKEVLKPLKRAA